MKVKILAEEGLQRTPGAGFWRPEITMQDETEAME